MNLLGAHEVPVSRLYAVARVLGVCVIIWATSGGLYLTLGGANRLRSNVWQPMVKTASIVVPADYAFILIGAVLLTGGLVGYLGLALEKRWLSLTSCVICTAWSGYATVLFAAIDVWPPIDDDNFIAFSQGLVTAVCILRFLLLSVIDQDGNTVRLR